MSKSAVAGALAGVCALAAAGSATPAQTRPQAPPAEQQQPRVLAPTGFFEGSSVRTDNGRWSNNPTSFRYEWQRCTSNDDDTCAGIGGADGVAYTLRKEDVGRRIRVIVAACNRDGCRNANSRITRVIQARFAPRNTRAPGIAGSAVAGQTLTGEFGAWDHGVFRFDVAWQRCDRNGAACGNISGARHRQYTLTSADIGMRVRFVVQAQNNKGSTTAVSAVTAVVAEPGPAGAIKLPSGETSIPVTGVSLPHRLVVSAVRFEPSVVRSRNQPLVGRFRVTDTRGYVIRDALVYAIGVPPNRVSVVGETTTGQDGWATVTYQILRGQPMRRGATIVFFVRARKPGDDLLAGVSTRRLVSVRVSP